MFQSRLNCCRISTFDAKKFQFIEKQSCNNFSLLSIENKNDWFFLVTSRRTETYRMNFRKIEFDSQVFFLSFALCYRTNIPVTKMYGQRRYRVYRNMAVIGQIRDKRTAELHIPGTFTVEFQTKINIFESIHQAVTGDFRFSTLCIFMHAK